MFDLPFQRFGIIDVLSEVDVLKDKNRQRGEDAENDEGSKHSKQNNVLEIGKELLTVHVVAGGEDDRRQDEVEEQIVVKRHDVGKFRVSDLHIDERDKDSYDTDEACLVSKFPVVLVLHGFEEHEKHQHHEDDDDSFVEHFVLFGFRFDRGQGISFRHSVKSSYFNIITHL